MTLKHRRIAIGAAIATTVVLTASSLSAVAGVPPKPDGLPQYYASTENASDPSTYKCLNPNGNGVVGYCMVTSQDLTDPPFKPGTRSQNYYPMNQTIGYFSTDGLNWQAANRKVILNESVIVGNKGTKHLWAPGVRARYNGAGPFPSTQYYLYTPDLQDAFQPTNLGRDRKLESRIFVTYSENPLGPFGTTNVVDSLGQSYGGKYKEVVLSNGNHGTSYMSDPEVFVDHIDTMNPNAADYLLWANGDAANCGDISIRRMTNEYTVQGFTNLEDARVKITGIPASWGKCRPNDDRSANDEPEQRATVDYVGSRLLPWARNQAADGTVPFPYIEGASLYRKDVWNRSTPAVGAKSAVRSTPGKYVMLLALKPYGVPAECSRPGQPGTANEVIAYATSDTVTGTYAYRGIIMCGSGKVGEPGKGGEYTNQASITEVRTAHGEQRLLLVYHDGPEDGAGGQRRKMHAECLLLKDGQFVTLMRTAEGAVSPSGAKQWCMNAQNIVAIKSVRNGKYLSSNNGLVAKSDYIGTWEQFDWYRSTGNESYKDFLSARNPGQWVQVNRSNGQVIARGASRGDWEGMTFRIIEDYSEYAVVEIINSWSGPLRDSLYLMTDANGTVIATLDPPTTATQKNYRFRLEYLSN